MNFAPQQTILSVAVKNSSEPQKTVPLQIESSFHLLVHWWIALFPVQQMKLIHVKMDSSVTETSFTLDLPQENPQQTEITITSLNSIETLFMHSIEGLIKEPHGCFEQVGCSLCAWLIDIIHSVSHVTCNQPFKLSFRVCNSRYQSTAILWSTRRRFLSFRESACKPFPYSLWHSGIPHNCRLSYQTSHPAWSLGICKRSTSSRWNMAVK